MLVEVGEERRREVTVKQMRRGESVLVEVGEGTQRGN
jgi:hypothetical protein